jgi:hypothetical protein
VNIIPTSRTGSASCVLAHERQAPAQKKEPAADASGGLPVVRRSCDHVVPSSFTCQPLRNGIVGLKLPTFLELRFHKWILQRRTLHPGFARLPDFRFRGMPNPAACKLILPSTKSASFRLVAYLLFEQPRLHALDALCPRSGIARWETLASAGPLLRVDRAGRSSFCSSAAIRT